MKRKIVVSFSGGETSAMLSYLMKTKYGADSSTELLFIFANTGNEREETLVFADKCDKYFGLNLVWVEAVVNPEFGKGIQHKVVNFETASRDGQPFEDVIKKYGIPNNTSPLCSKFLKGRVIKSYCKSIGWIKWNTALGIRIDEPSRLNWKRVKEEGILYPLATDFFVSKQDVWNFWDKQPFKLGLKTYEGNCQACWKKSKRKLMTIALENPTAFDFFREMEEKYENFVPDTKGKKRSVKPPIRFFRDNLTVNDIFEDSRLPFDLALDERLLPRIPSLFWTEDMDSNFGCVESCEGI